MKQYLFLSPHLDDAILSCGAYIYKLARNNSRILIATVFSGSADTRQLSQLAADFNSRCNLNNDAMKTRRAEDIKAAKSVNADTVHLNLLECLYRQTNDELPQYTSPDDIFIADLNKEKETVDKVESVLWETFNPADYEEIYVPLGIGRHIDHLILRKAAEDLYNGSGINKLIYYEDIPYVCDDRDISWRTELTNGLVNYPYNISKNEFRRYLKAVALYKSQKHVLWYTRDMKMKQLGNHFRVGKDSAGFFWRR